MKRTYVVYKIILNIAVFLFLPKYSKGDHEQRLDVKLAKQALATSTCGRTLPKSHDEGGIHPQIVENPWIAMLGFQDKVTMKVDYLCSGTLIHEKFVLTAAHCLKEKFLLRHRLAHVRLGEYNISSPVDHQNNYETEAHDFDVEEFITHPYYNIEGQLDNDIALLKLAKPVDLHAYRGFINTICLPQSDTDVDKAIEKSLPITVGWDLAGGHPSHTLMGEALLSVEHEHCEKAYRGYSRTQQLCLMPNKKTRCVGDAGSPLIVEVPDGVNQFVQIGLLSYGPFPTCNLNNPVVFASIAYYVDWIALTIYQH